MATFRLRGNVKPPSLKRLYEKNRPSVGDIVLSSGGKAWQVITVKRADTKGGIKKPATEIVVKFTGGPRKIIVFTEKLWV